MTFPQVCFFPYPLLTAATPLRDHVLVVLEGDAAELVEVQHGDGREVRRAALHRRDEARVDAVDERLDDGVVGGVGVVGGLLIVYSMVFSNI